MRLTQFLQETSKSEKLVALKAKLAKLEADYKDMNVTPTSQKIADAIDAARDEIKDVKKEIAALNENVGYDAADAYMARVREVKDLLAQISNLVDQHNKKQQANATSWGFAGDMAHVAEQLRDIGEFLSDQPK
jgi:uncharacterized protein YukE